MRVDVSVLRGDILESRHRVEVVACDSQGLIRVAAEHSDRITTFRSAAKPFQLLPVVERGHAERWGWTDEHLAIMSASHTGSRAHVALVREILSRLGLGEEALACGYHDPLDAESLADVRANPSSRSAVYNNCSGKHAGMLCLALSEGWPIQGYEKASHPLQVLMREVVADVTGNTPSDLQVAVDGCGVSVFGLSLAGMARAYGRLATADPNGPPRERALARIRHAMTSHPWAVAGPGRLSTALMEAAPGRLVAKGGAEGLECVGDSVTGMGMALKCEDGHSRAVGPALLAVLAHLGWLDPAAGPVAPWRRPIVRNHAGLEVGALEAVVRIHEPAAS